MIEGVPADRLKALSRGVNADGWIADPRSAPPRNLLLELRKAGMTHIRLPVPADFVMPRFAAKAEIDSRLRTVDAALKTLLGLGYAVSIDLHSGERFNALHKDDPTSAMTELKRAWTELATVMQRYPSDRVFAELLNEPDIEAAQWQGEVRELAGFIRGLLPQTTLVTGPVNWQRADSLPGFTPLDDPNVVYAIHFYDPMVFTHQAHWDPNEPLHDVTGLPFPVRADESRGSTAAGAAHRAGQAQGTRDGGPRHSRPRHRQMARACRRLAAAIFAADHHQRIRCAQGRSAARQPAALARRRDGLRPATMLGLDPLGAVARLRPRRPGHRQGRPRCAAGPARHPLTHLVNRFLHNARLDRRCWCGTPTRPVTLGQSLCEQR
ncbi:hypothetical protein ABIF25_009550 [Bradyrhizobium elkanii]|uniref:glycoside hydrolase family 5 protein n=1 Tax=Bradyrhizobium elkanii TaxID=29448 RepID=UPI003516B972